ncbi:MAG: hypothetical protein GTO55_12180 [Armatimonadetes bacterium]|nr:hypothetical protein [Armatimonadota bacterium]NIM24972.1 hypothetical protein [Armatimonadota bacterium]NIM68856.1 hypothetical protein [Armatimonadota bacterium]NIN07067.1 hypothetical protein [Armatimonadota bacterium]NIO99040.1 hypothetical protein [Armatimonadota bacterium]
MKRRLIIAIVLTITLGTATAIIVILQNRHSRVRRADVAEVGRELYSQLQSSDPAERSIAVSQLAANVDLGFHDLKPALKALRSDPSQRVRERAALALALCLTRQSEPRKLQILSSLLDAMTEDPSADVRRFISYLVSDSLHGLLGEESPEFQNKVINLSVPYLEKALEDSDADVCEHAEWALDIVQTSVENH